MNRTYMTRQNLLVITRRLKRKLRIRNSALYAASSNEVDQPCRRPYRPSRPTNPLTFSFQHWMSQAYHRSADPLFGISSILMGEYQTPLQRKDQSWPVRPYLAAILRSLVRSLPPLPPDLPRPRAGYQATCSSPDPAKMQTNPTGSSSNQIWLTCHAQWAWFPQLYPPSPFPGGKKKTNHC